MGGVQVIPPPRHPAFQGNEQRPGEQFPPVNQQTPPPYCPPSSPTPHMFSGMTSGSQQSERLPYLAPGFEYGLQVDSVVFRPVRTGKRVVQIRATVRASICPAREVGSRCISFINAEIVGGMLELRNFLAAAEGWSAKMSPSDSTTPDGRLWSAVIDHALSSSEPYRGRLVNVHVQAGVSRNGRVFTRQLWTPPMAPLAR